MAAEAVYIVVKIVVSALIVVAWLVSSLVVAVRSAVRQAQGAGEVDLFDSIRFDSVLDGLLVAAMSSGLVYLLVRMVWVW